MRPVEASEAMRGVGRLPVRCTHGDGVLKQVRFFEHPTPDSAWGLAGQPRVSEAMVTVARHHGADVVVPIGDVRVLEYGDY